jgi:ribosomal protein S18 acetylase RimI-like enzyme
MITTVKNKSLLFDFVNLPEKLYKDDPNWVKPFVGSDVRDFIKGKNQALQHLDMEMYVCSTEGGYMGRVTAFEDKQYNKLHQVNNVFFGFFECVDNLEAAKDLLNAVDIFAKAKKADFILGPVDFSTNYQAGFLIDGFLRPTVMTPYNKSYYPQLVESCGYKKHIDLYAYSYKTTVPIPERLQKLAELIQKKRPDVDIRTFSQIKRLPRSQMLTNIYNSAFSANWGFIPMTDKEFSHLVNNIFSMGYQDINYMAFAGNEPVGLLLTLPDLYSAPNIKTLRVTVLGVIPAYRRKGIETLMVSQLLTDTLNGRYQTLEFSVILENNVPMNNFIRREAQLSPSKTFRVYEKPHSY